MGKHRNRDTVSFVVLFAFLFVSACTLPGNSTSSSTTQSPPAKDQFAYPFLLAQTSYIIEYNINPNLDGTNHCYKDASGQFVAFNKLWHTGEDWFPASHDQPVLAVANGVVKYISPSWYSYPGAVVIIEHTLVDKSIVYSMYGHLDYAAIEVAIGATVQKGQPIAKHVIPQRYGNLDNTHLHWEIRTFYNGKGITIGGSTQSCSDEPGPGYSWPGRPDSFTFNGTTYHWFNPSAFIASHGGPQRGASQPNPTRPAGIITEYPLPGVNSVPYSLASGPDGNVWYTEFGYDPNNPTSYTGKIGRMTPDGHATEFPLATASSFPYGITSGPDGNLWFTEFTYDFQSKNFFAGKIGRITVNGAITEVPLPNTGAIPYSITAGPDGNLWFTEIGFNISQSSLFVGKIGKITPTGAITEYPLSGANKIPNIITAGPDGNLWFTELGYSTSGSSLYSGAIGRITPSGTISEFPLNTPNLVPDGIAIGPDGNIWFTESASYYGNALGKIGRVIPSPFI